MSLLLTPNPTVLYILAVVCFTAFLVGLLWYIFAIKKNSINSKQTKSWTIESAKKFLESQNIDTQTTKPAVKENAPQVVKSEETVKKAPIKRPVPKNMPVNKTTQINKDKVEK